jgi:4-hydroxy-2-oxoheptanedioate aldolase
MLFFGPGDYSQGLGCPGDSANPRVSEARRRVAEAARQHGKFAGTVGSPAVLEELFDLGYQFVNISVDVLSLVTTFQQAVKAFEELAHR